MRCVCCVWCGVVCCAVVGWVFCWCGWVPRRVVLLCLHRRIASHQSPVWLNPSLAALSFFSSARQSQHRSWTRGLVDSFSGLAHASAGALSEGISGVIRSATTVPKSTWRTERPRIVPNGRRARVWFNGAGMRPGMAGMGCSLHHHSIKKKNTMLPCQRRHR